jgi:hypothetical protein
MEDVSEQRERSGAKTALDFLAACTVLTANLDLFHGGVRPTYRVLATELRKLMCDGKSTLLPRVFKDLPLHKLHWTHVLESAPSLAEDMAFLMPGQLRVADGKTRFRLSFAKTREVMPLEAWLEQPILRPGVSVRDLIRSVANKEGAHSDPDYNATLAEAKRVQYGQDESHLHTIAGIAEYVLDVLRIEPLEPAEGIPLRRRQDGAWERT